jgi:acyl carrier protein
MSCSPDTFLIEYFKTKSPQLNFDDPYVLTTDFIQTGILDSLGVLELIEAVEAQYSIAFSTEDLENPTFKTIEGLRQIISEKIANDR